MFSTTYTTVTGDPAVGPLVDFDHDQINQMSVYEVVCGLFVDEDEAEYGMPYQMYQWHPDGAHFEGSSSTTDGIHIVVTDFTADHHYDIGIYDDAWMEGDMDPIESYHIPITAVGALLRVLLLQGGAERIYSAWRDGQPAPTPLPAPQLSAAALAAEYIAQVRRNGPEAIGNVAGLGERYGSAYPAVQPAMMPHHVVEVAYEVDEHCDNPIDIDLPSTDDEQEMRFEACKIAARTAIEQFRLDLLGYHAPIAGA